jgi:3-hydroxyisobutyrate dehydrogenase-like beta-hydroxyacid dehydrogenase
VCIIGFGESGAALGAALAQRGHAVRAWDILLEDPAHREMMQARIAGALAEPATSLADAVKGAKLVICAVGAASAAGVRRDVDAMLVAGQKLLDLDTTSPATRLEALGFAYDPVVRQTSRRGELP